MSQHLDSVKSPGFRPFPCSQAGCNYAAKEKSNLTRHSKIHSDVKSFLCSQPNCNYSANQKRYLIDHIRIHTGEKPFVCQFESCSYAAAQQGHLVIHSRTHTKERPFKCTELNCEYSTTQSSNLKTHQLNHQPEDGEERPLFSCPLCEYKGKTKGELSSHVKSHTLEKWFKCDEPNCNFEAKTKKEIGRHKVVHSDEKSFACSIQSCEFRCKSKRNLTAHLKSHSDERRYKCELCPYRGKTRNYVISHLRQVHSDLRPFKCPEQKCDYAAKTNSDLTTHLLIHTSENKYSCSFPDCSFRALRKGQVNRHECNIHSEEKKEKCSICLYKFKTKAALTTHFRTHTKEKPYACKENSKGCAYRANTASSLKQHVQNYHSETF